MGIRFQKRITLFPGVRLNFSASGVSTTIGPRGATFTLSGSRGPSVNLGIPGTGLSYRQGLGGRGGRRAAGESGIPEVDETGAPSAALPSSAAIGSAPLEGITSEGLADFKRLVEEAVREREGVNRVLPIAQEDRRKAEARLRRAEHWFFRPFIGSKAPERRAQLEEATKEVGALEARLEGAFVEADCNLAAPARAKWEELAGAFEDLLGCDRIWDVTQHESIDRSATRSSASGAVARTCVRFSFGEDEIVHTDARCLRLSNANGADLLLFPGFVLMRGDAELGIVDVREVTLNFEQVRFIEAEGTIPPDASLVGKAWAKANKDGSPDRRFKDNYQMPIARYGGFTLESPTGLREQYLISNCAAAERFARVFHAYQRALGTNAGQAHYGPGAAR